MKSNYKLLSKYIREVNGRNLDGSITALLGINIDKYYMPSVANVVGTDMTVYKIVRKGQFACNRMHVGRDKRLPVALSKSDTEFIVSPAYDVFEIIDESILTPEYLMMWFSRKEFDRNAWFYTDADVRGGLHWKALCNMQLPIPSIEKQKEIVAEYNTVVNRIKLNEQLNEKLEETAQAIFKQWVVDFEFPDKNGNPYKSSSGKMEYNAELEREIPRGWRVVKLGSLCDVVTKGTTPQEMFTENFQDAVTYIKAESISENHSIDESMLSFIDMHTDRLLARSQLKEGDILFSIAGTLGKFSLISKRLLPANINQAIAIIRLDTTKVNRNYIIGLFLGGWQKLFYSINTQQAVQANLSLTTIKALPIIIPSKEYEEIINDIVSPLVNLLHAINTQTQSLTTLTHTILQKMAKDN